MELKFNEYVFYKILDLLENGYSVQDSCKIAGINRGTLYQSLNPKQRYLLFQYTHLYNYTFNILTRKHKDKALPLREVVRTNKREFEYFPDAFDNFMEIRYDASKYLKHF